PAVAPPPMFGVTDEPKKSKAPLAIAAIVILAILGAGGWFMFKPADKPAKPVKAAATPAPPPPQKAQVIPTAVVAAATNTAPVRARTDGAPKQKAFEAAVEQKLQQEMMKLQADYTKTLQKSQAKNAPVQVAQVTPPPAATPAPAPVVEDRSAPSAAAL